MIRRLRAKLVAIIMAFAAVILVCVMTAVLGLTRATLERESLDRRHAADGEIGPGMNATERLRHPGTGRDPASAPKAWIPACAGMTGEMSACGKRHH